MSKVFPKDDLGSQPPPKNPVSPWWYVLLGDSELSVEKSESGWRGKVRTSGLVLLAMFVLAAAAWLKR
jgi:hypothetical protein